MSEELSNHTGGTCYGQNSTRKEGISLPDINLSVHLHLIISPALQAALEKIAEALETAGKQPEIMFHGLTSEQAKELVTKDVIDPRLTELDTKQELVQVSVENEKISVKDEKNPAKNEKMPVNSGVVSTKDEKHGRIVFGGSYKGWESISAHPHLRWKTTVGVLHCGYGSAIIETTWDEIERLSKLCQKERIAAIQIIIGDIVPNKKRTALTLFVRLYAEGKIKRPENPDEELENNFSRFQAEEDLDPDAAYKPMLTSYSTRPDDNCGKVEGCLEV